MPRARAGMCEAAITVMYRTYRRKSKELSFEFARGAARPAVHSRLGSPSLTCAVPLGRLWQGESTWRLTSTPAERKCCRPAKPFSILDRSLCAVAGCEWGPAA
jgi:hypothetical protein